MLETLNPQPIMVPFGSRKGCGIQNSRLPKQEPTLFDNLLVVGALNKVTSIWTPIYRTIVLFRGTPEEISLFGWKPPYMDIQ